MSLVVVAVSRIIEAAAALDKLDPNRELKDQVSQSIRLSAVQNGTSGNVTTTRILAARVDELLAPPPALIETSPVVDVDSPLDQAHLTDPVDSDQYATDV